MSVLLEEAKPAKVIGWKLTPPKYEELSLPFGYTDAEDLKTLTGEIKSFLYGLESTYDTKRPHIEYDKETKALSKGLSIRFSERKRALYGASDAQPFYTRYHNFYSQFFQGLHKVAESNTLLAKLRSSVHLPRYLEITRGRSKSFTVDFGYKVCEPKYNRRNETNGNLIARVWIHTEYVYLKAEERHIVDMNKSWVSIFSSKVPSDIFTMRFDSLDKLDEGLVFPWTGLPDTDKWSTAEWVKQIYRLLPEFLDGNAEFKSFIPNSYDQPSSHLSVGKDRYGIGYRDREQYKTIALSSATSADIRGFFDEFIRGCAADSISGRNQTGYVDPNAPLPSGASSITVYPYVFKTVLKALNSWSDNKKKIDAENARLLEEQRKANDEARRAGRPVGGIVRTVTQYPLPALKAKIGLLAYLCHYFEDPSFIDHADLENNPLIPATTNNANYYAYTNAAIIKQMLEDPYFASFPKAKQMRLAAQIFVEQTFNSSTPRDIVTMLNNVRDRRVKPEDKIAPRRVKTLTQLHDEITTVYNEIRYEAIPVDIVHYQPLVELGLEIPNTDFELVIPETSNVVRSWGQTQRHCIGSYAENCARGTTVLLGVRYRESGEWFGHLQMHTFKSIMDVIIRGMKGERNVRATNTYTNNAVYDVAAGNNWRLGNSTNSYTIYTQSGTKVEIPKEEEALDKFLDENSAYFHVGSYVNQFYGKGNSALPADEKQKVFNHIGLAVRTAVKKELLGIKEVKQAEKEKVTNG